MQENASHAKMLDDFKINVSKSLQKQLYLKMSLRVPYRAQEDPLGFLRNINIMKDEYDKTLTIIRKNEPNVSSRANEEPQGFLIAAILARAFYVY